MALYAINSGYWDTKAYNGKQMFKFRSKMDESFELLGSNSNSFKVNYEGKDYLIGDGASKYSLEYDKTNSLLHKLVTYSALAKYAQVREEFNAMVALPLSVYSSLKNQYENYIRTRDFTSIMIDGERKWIHVKNCRVFPECVAALYANNPSKYKDSIIGVLDFGSLTVNGCILNNLNLIRDSVFTINEGTIILFNKLKHELNSRFLLNIQEYQIPYIIREGLSAPGVSKETSDKIINDVLSDHVLHLVNSMRQYNWPVESMPILLTGGGSILMEKYLRREHAGSFLSNNPVFDNCIGLYNVGEVVFREADH